MIVNVRTMNNRVNYERFVKGIAFLDYFLKEKAVFYVEPKKSDCSMLNVMVNERERCPMYVRQLFEAFVGGRKEIKINMRILNKYYAKLLKPLFVCAKCENVIALSALCRLFVNCTVINIEMEVAMNGDVQCIINDEFVQNLLSEMEQIEQECLLQQVRIYQIEIAQKYVAQM